MSGWISLHRKIRQNAVFNDVQLLRLWLICLMEASHKEHKILVGKQMVELQPGQFVTGRFEIGAKYNEGLKPKDRVQDLTVWRWLKTLESLDFLIIESNNKFSLCTVAKWAFYQNNDQQNDQQMINKRSTNDQQMITNNNVNKGNNDNKGNKKDSADANASKRFIKPTIQDVFEYCQERKNNVNPEKWYDHYESNGWKVGKNAMKDWKAAVRTWEKNSSTSLSKTSGNYSNKTEKKSDLLDQLFWSEDDGQKTGHYLDEGNQ
jgi:hypothetical protein